MVERDSHRFWRFRRAPLVSGWVHAGAVGALLALGTLAAQETFRITRVEAEGGQVELSWEGEAALHYFEVQKWNGEKSGGWEPVALTAHRTIALDRQGLQGYLRVAAVRRPEPVTPISDIRRSEILAEVAQTVASLPGDDAVADAAVVAGYLRQHPDFEAVGVSAGAAVHAYFRDGRPFLIINDRVPADPAEFENGVDLELLRGGRAIQPAPVPETPGGDAGAAPGVGRALRTVSGTSGLPVSRRAVLFQAAGMGIASPMIDVLAPAFQGAGYQVHSQEASLPNFLAASSFGSDIGVFYVDAHGGIFRARIQQEDEKTGDVLIRYVPFFVVATSTVATPGTDALYRATLFDTGEIGYVQLGSSILKGIRRNLPDPEPKPVVISPTYYFIMPEFVRKRWRFSRNSIVLFDTCHSARDEAASFIDICYAAGAALYAGWTESVHDAWAFKCTTPPLFDLLLGGSHIYRMDPPQRPFEISAVLQYLDAMGLRVDGTPGFPGARFVCRGGPAGNGSFQILNPSILSMGVVESNDEVIVSGHFDPEAPTVVRVEGGATAEIPPSAMTRSSLTFPLPADGSPSAGDVTIVQRGRNSNTIPLSEWTVDATLVHHFSIGIPNPSATMEFKLLFRADVHEARLRPFADPGARAGGATIARGTTGRVVSASGTYHYPENQGSLEWSLDSPVDVPFPGLRGTLSIAADRSATLTAGLLAGDVMTVTQKNPSGQVILTYKREPGSRTFPPAPTSLDPSSYRLKAGSGSAAGDSGTFDWKDADPRFPPTGNFAR